MKERNRLRYYLVISFIFPDKKKHQHHLAWADFYITAQTAMLLSNYQLITLNNNLLDIFAHIHINLVNFVGTLSK